MRRAGTLSTALRLPPSPSAVVLEIVRGRQRVVRLGLFITSIRGRRRMVYQQLDGEIILADECECQCNWPEGGGPHGLSFEIVRSADCPIDEHLQLCLQGMQEEEVLAEG